MMGFIFVTLGYLLGSIPFGLVLTKIAGGEDIRNIGSGNIGATNVLRTGNKTLAILTLLFDILKGAVAVWISFVSQDAFIILVTALAAIIGHMFPVWLKFKGGKGVATTLGAVFALLPALGLAMCGIWVVMAVIFRISSLAALTAFALAPVLSQLWLGDPELAVLTGAIAALVFWKHEANIKRILKGEESKITFKKDKNEPSPTSE